MDSIKKYKKKRRICIFVFIISLILLIGSISLAIVRDNLQYSLVFIPAAILLILTAISYYLYGTPADKIPDKEVIVYPRARGGFWSTDNNVRTGGGSSIIGVDPYRYPPSRSSLDHIIIEYELNVILRNTSSCERTRNLATQHIFETRSRLHRLSLSYLLRPDEVIMSEKELTPKNSPELDWTDKLEL